MEIFLFFFFFIRTCKPPSPCTFNFFLFKRRNRQHSFIPFLTRHRERVDGKLNSFSQYENWMSVVATRWNIAFLVVQRNVRFSINNSETD